MSVGSELATPVPALNQMINRGLQILHQGIGRRMDDRSNTWDPPDNQRIAFFLPDEVNTSQPIHMVLMALAAVYIFSRISKSHDKDLSLYTACTLGTFLLFCVFVKWSPYNNRLHLPFFVLCSPAIGIAADRLKKGWFVYGATALLLVSALFYAFANQSRPLVGKDSIFSTDRTHQYFRIAPDFYNNMTVISEFVALSGAKNIGLAIESDTWEYPYWVFLKRNIPHTIRIEHIDVENISGEIRLPDFHPDAIIMSRREPRWGQKYSRETAKGFYIGGVFIFLRTLPTPPVADANPMITN